MDQHPIPQNVTGFQFKLIGAMTVKQFGYVAVGVIGAFIVYSLPIKGVLGLFLKATLIPLFGASGAIIAFLPIDGRPVDVMAGNFLKALLSPNQYIYRKNANKFSFSSIASQKKNVPSHDKKGTSLTPQQQMTNDRGLALQKILITNAAKSTNNPQDAREAAFLSAISKNTLPEITLTTSPLSKPAPVTLPPLQNLKPTAPQPTVQKEVAPEVLQEKETSLKKQLEFAKKEEAAQHAPSELSALHQKTLELEKQVAEIHTQKSQLEQEILKLKSQLRVQQAPVPSITSSKKAPDPIPGKVTQAAHVRSVPKELNKKMGLLVSDTPNVVAGVVKDARGNVLPNILVEIKDKDNNPVRAFKTNSLGNFASATPLSIGNYSITLEDPKKLHTFDEIKITANGQIMLPIEIISYDKREELRKELFS